MRRRILMSLLLVSGASAPAGVLYDPAGGTAPGDPVWLLAAPSPVGTLLAGGRFTIDTRPGGTGALGGMFTRIPEEIRARDGLTLRFSLQVVGEAHATPHRSGVSVILLDADRRGVELAFWEDRVWAQSDGPLFTHAEEAPMDTVTAPVTYALSLSATAYHLTANGSPLLSGPIRDYTSAEVMPDVYEIPGLVFLGDDTRSASGAFSVGRIEWLPAPPVLSIRRPGEGHLELRWPAAPDSWIAEESPGPGGPWTAVGEAVRTADGFDSIRVSLDSAAHYYRLRP